MNFCVAKSILGIRDKTMKKTKSQLLDSMVGKETGERQWTKICKCMVVINAMKEKGKEKVW